MYNKIAINGKRGTKYLCEIFNISENDPVTVTNDVLAHIFKDFRSYEFSPLLHNHW